MQYIGSPSYKAQTIWHELRFLSCYFGPILSRIPGKVICETLDDTYIHHDWSSSNDSNHNLGIQYLVYHFYKNQVLTQTHVKGEGIATCCMQYVINKIWSMA